MNLLRGKVSLQGNHGPKCCPQAHASLRRVSVEAQPCFGIGVHRPAPSCSATMVWGSEEVSAASRPRAEPGWRASGGPEPRVASLRTEDVKTGG